MANLIGDSLSKANGAATEFKNKIQDTGHMLASSAQDLRQPAAAISSGFASAASDSMKYSRDYVKENPAKGVAIAAATGLVAGSLLTMMMSGRKN